MLKANQEAKTAKTSQAIAYAVKKIFWLPGEKEMFYQSACFPSKKKGNLKLIHSLPSW